MLVPLEAMDPGTIGSTIATAVQTTFMSNLGAVIGLVAVLVGVSLIVRFTRKNAKA